MKRNLNFCLIFLFFDLFLVYSIEGLTEKIGRSQDKK